MLYFHSSSASFSKQHFLFHPFVTQTANRKCFCVNNLRHYSLNFRAWKLSWSRSNKSLRTCPNKLASMYKELSLWFNIIAQSFTLVLQISLVSRVALFPGRPFPGRSGIPIKISPEIWKRHVSEVLNEYRGALIICIYSSLGGGWNFIFLFISIYIKRSYWKKTSQKVAHSQIWQNWL